MIPTLLQALRPYSTLLVLLTTLYTLLFVLLPTLFRFLTCFKGITSPFRWAPDVRQLVVGAFEDLS